jgi:hypothetical protein
MGDIVAICRPVNVNMYDSRASRFGEDFVANLLAVLANSVSVTLIPFAAPAFSIFSDTLAR